MEERKHEIENVYNSLTEENKDVLNLIAKGMQVAQENGKESE